MSVFDFLAQSSLPRPSVTVDDARRIARERYGVEGEPVELGSNQDRNFRFDGPQGRMLLKVSNAAFGTAELTAQNLAADAVTAAGLRAPVCIPSLDGNALETVDGMQVRLLSYVEGEPEFDAAGLGTLAARVALALRDLDHPGAAQRTQWNLRLAGEVIDLLIGSVGDSRRPWVRRVADDALARLEPLRDRLRTQVIHGDVTDDNVLLPDGVIDFGDIATSWTVAELAVACIPALHGPRPLEVLDTIAAFHAVLPLTDDELDALWPLVQLRAAVLVVSGDHQVSLDAGNVYADENRRHEWRAFTRAAALDAGELRALIAWRLGAGLGSGSVEPPSSLLLDARHAVPIDLSVTSPQLDEGAWLEPHIEERLGIGAGFGVTAWGVPRLTRGRALAGADAATVPLGVEVRVAEQTEVRATASGTVRHAEGFVVLGLASGEVWIGGLDGIAAEGPVEAGAALGRLAPHPAVLSVQFSRVPGHRPPAFVSLSVAALWKQVCPDPSVLLGREPAPEVETAAAVLAERDSAFARVQEHYYDDPPRIERGWREHLIDTDGQVYLDMVNNVATVGHGHPRLSSAVARQWSMLNTNSRFHYAAVAEFSRRLASLAPEGLDTVFLVNSGSEAVDLALRLALAATGRPTLLTMREAYHGWTIGSDAVSSSIGDNPRALETRPDWVRMVDAPYRVGADASLASLDAVLHDSVAGFIAEPIFGNGGGVLLPDGYLAAAYEKVRAAGGVCIADEVQVGYGRLGSHFWGFEQQGVVPDVITMAKAMGNGHPLGAVITTRAIADAFAAEGSMFSSAGGSPVSCVVGSTVLDIVQEEGLIENARVVGEHLRARLLGFGYPVHGMGLYLGVELPDGAFATAVCDALRLRGVIMQPTGDHKNVLKIKPPMVITRQSVDYFADQLAEVLTEV